MRERKLPGWAMYLLLGLALFAGGSFVIWITNHYLGTTRRQIGSIGAFLVVIGVVVVLAVVFAEDLPRLTRQFPGPRSISGSRNAVWSSGLCWLRSGTFPATA